MTHSPNMDLCNRTFDGPETQYMYVSICIRIYLADYFQCSQYLFDQCLTNHLHLFYPLSIPLYLYHILIAEYDYV